MNSALALSTLISTARSYAGCSARTDPDRFGRIVAPNGPAWARSFFCRVMDPGDPESSCTVFACGTLAVALALAGRSELQEPLDATGATGAWKRAVALAKVHNAYRSPEDASPGLRPGCIVHLESTRRHWIVLLEDRGYGVWTVVAGGDLDAGYQRITETQHEIRGGNYDRASLLPVADWIDTQALFEALLPAVESDPPDAAVG